MLSVAVAAYASDCGGMTTPDQVMHCCNSMRCSSHHHHGQECCKTMPAVQAVLSQPPSVQGISFPPVAIGLMTAFNESNGIELSTHLIAEHSHAPPISSSPPALSLRI